MERHTRWSVWYSVCVESLPFFLIKATIILEWSLEYLSNFYFSAKKAHYILLQPIYQVYNSPIPRTEFTVYVINVYRNIHMQCRQGLSSKLSAMAIPAVLHSVLGLLCTYSTVEWWQQKDKSFINRHSSQCYSAPPTAKWQLKEHSMLYLRAVLSWEVYKIPVSLLSVCIPVYKVEYQKNLTEQHIYRTLWHCHSTSWSTYRIPRLSMVTKVLKEEHGCIDFKFVPFV